MSRMLGVESYRLSERKADGLCIKGEGKGLFGFGILGVQTERTRYFPDRPRRSGPDEN